MTYSLHTLQSPSSKPAPEPTGLAKFANEMALVVGFMLIAFWLIALLSYSHIDAAWSTSGAGGAIHNRAGRLGAWMADMSYFLFGFSPKQLCQINSRSMQPMSVHTPAQT